MPLSIDKNKLDEDLAELRATMALREKREREYSDSKATREHARTAYAELLARPGPLDADEHRAARLRAHQAEVALGASSRALLEIKHQVDMARLEYDQDRLRTRGGPASRP